MEPENRLFSIVKEILQTALISLGIFFLVYIFLVQPHRVKGDSMFPNFKDGELLLTEKVSYRIYKPQRGDVVVFKAPGSRNVDYIKRIIGLPSEEIKITGGEIFINGEKLDEPYETQISDGDVTLTLLKEEYFVMGDNRGASSDSRSFGPIKKSSIRGKTWLVYWPVVKSSKYEGARTISGVKYTVPDSFKD